MGKERSEDLEGGGREGSPAEVPVSHLELLGAGHLDLDFQPLVSQVSTFAPHSQLALGTAQEHSQLTLVWKRGLGCHVCLARHETEPRTSTLTPAPTPRHPKAQPNSQKCSGNPMWYQKRRQEAAVAGRGSLRSQAAWPPGPSTLVSKKAKCPGNKRPDAKLSP